MGFTGSGFLLFEPRNSVFKSKIEARLGIESMRGRWDAKKTLGITELHEILSRDYEIEGPYWGPSYFKQRIVRNYRESRHTQVGGLYPRGLLNMCSWPFRNATPL